MHLIYGNMIELSRALIVMKEYESIPSTVVKLIALKTLLNRVDVWLS